MCEGEGTNVVDHVINRVEKCGVRGGEKAYVGKKKREKKYIYIYIYPGTARKRKEE